MKRSLKISFCGGGTGGHLFPALNIAQAASERWDCSFLFFGTQNGIEAQKVPEAGYEIVYLPITGIQRRFTLQNFAVPFKLWKSISISKKSLRAFKPDLVIGTGGYVMGPVLIAAHRLNIPIVLQEQNSYPGITSRKTAKTTDLIFTAYKEAARYLKAGKAKIIESGNPISHRRPAERGEIFKFFGMDESKAVILAFGGSQGAANINRALLKILTDRILPEGWQLLWQTGINEFERIQELVNQRQIQDVHPVPFIDRMTDAYSIAEFAVCRAGAMTLSELMAAGLPAVLVPYPYAAADHQYKNAQVLLDHQAALVIRDNQELEENLSRAVLHLTGSKDIVKQLAVNIAAMHKKDTMKIILDSIEDLLEQKKKAAQN